MFGARVAPLSGHKDSQPPRLRISDSLFGEVGKVLTGRSRRKKLTAPEGQQTNREKARSEFAQEKAPTKRG